MFLLHWLLQQLCHVVDDPGVSPGLGILSVAVVTVITAHADCRVAPVELQVPVKHNLDQLVIKWDNVISYLNTFSHQYYISSFSDSQTILSPHFVINFSQGNAGLAVNIYSTLHISKPSLATIHSDIS